MILCMLITCAEIYCSVPPEAQARLNVHGYISKAANGALVYLAFLPPAILDHCECRGCKYCGAVNFVILASVGNDDNRVSLLG